VLYGITNVLLLEKRKELGKLFLVPLLRAIGGSVHEQLVPFGSR
jgi:hypothetical protein